MLEKIVSKGKKILKNLVGSVIVGASILSLGGVRNSEASIVEQEYFQTSPQTQSTQPIITMLDYRYGDIDAVSHSALYVAQSFIALDSWIIDGSLKLGVLAEYNHNMYLKIWEHDSTNNWPDIANEIGTTINELDPSGNELVDYYLSEFGFSAVQVIPGERYWLGLYNPDNNPYGLGQWSVDYGNQNPYPDGSKIGKYSNDYPWVTYGDGRDLAFSVTFSNVDESSLLELLLAGFSLTGLFLNKKFRKNKN